MSIARHVAVVGIATLASRVLGFVRDVAIAGLFGTGFRADAFVIGGAVLLMAVLLPALGTSGVLFWEMLPHHQRTRLRPGTELAVVVPLCFLGGLLALALGPSVESFAFGADFKGWLSTATGLIYDQRNSLVVAIAIGFAVIPTIFTISEDAVFSVPRHLTMGSLALGATPWQTAIKVVLLTASPGIFSAIMIGMGRAVGETMIVLMATGNTPIMDLSLFQGLRALSANIAVEMPESELNSTHYRVLFLAAMVLFLVTFAVNTLAEVVRQRLRRKYGSL